MDSILVLGLIPGTDIAIGFWAWIGLMALLAVAFKLYGNRVVTLAERQIEVWWERFTENVGILEHKPLHASQLHRRLPRPARRIDRIIAALQGYIAAHRLGRRLIAR